MKMDNIKEIQSRLREIEKNINDLVKERKVLAKRLQEIRYKERLEKPKVYLRIVNKKYLVANSRVGNKVYTVYLGDKRLYGDWKKSKRVKNMAIEKMKKMLEEKNIK